MRAIWVGLLALGLGACASGTTIKTGEAKTPVPADQVQIYTDAPENYETLGLVRASSEMGLLDQQSMNYAIKELKKRAGAIGANGVLLSTTGKKSTGLSGAFLPNGGFIASSDSEMIAEGTAIYVPK